MGKIVCFSTIATLVGREAGDFEIDAVPLSGMRFLIIWALKLELLMKIPGRKREK